MTSLNHAFGFTTDDLFYLRQGTRSPRQKRPYQIVLLISLICAVAAGSGVLWLPIYDSQLRMILIGCVTLLLLICAFLAWREFITPIECVTGVITKVTERRKPKFNIPRGSHIRVINPTAKLGEIILIHILGRILLLFIYSIPYWIQILIFKFIPFKYYIQIQDQYFRVTHDQQEQFKHLQLYHIYYNNLTKKIIAVETA